MKKQLLVAMGLFMLSPAAVWAEPLRAGAAVIDITPPTGFPMWGYAARGAKPSVGVNMPLQARAVVVAAGQKKLAIVSLDLGRAPTRASTQRIRKQLHDNLAIDMVFLVASHTHHGPVLELDTWPSVDKPYTRQLEEKIGAVIVAAHKNSQAARLGIASHEVPFNRNRHSKRPGPPRDAELILVRLEDLEGRPIAHLVNFAAHPTMLPAKLLEFSPDYPGHLVQHVDRELGGVCLFLQGAAGDLSPNPPAGQTGPEKFGEALGAFVVARSGKLACTRTEVKKLQARETDFRFRPRTDISNPLIRTAYSFMFFPALIDFYEREYRDGVRPHLTTALCDDIGIVGVSGEFFSSHAVQLKRRARLEHLLFLGYCNDYQQYFPTIEAVGEGGYGADATVAQAEVGAGEQMMDRALMDLLAMRGKLR